MTGQGMFNKTCSRRYQTGNIRIWQSVRNAYMRSLQSSFSIESEMPAGFYLWEVISN
jgi:hypothetical protein